MFDKPVSHPATQPPQSLLTALTSRIAGHFAVRWLRQNALVVATVPLIAAVSFTAYGDITAPSIPAIALSADPLYAATSGEKPTLALALSVEFPTVGAQYVDPDNNNSSTTDDVTYSPTIEYLGYYDAESCYTYDDAGTGAPSGQTSAYKRFVRRGPAIALSTPNTANPTWTTRMCWNGTTSYTKDDGTSPAASTSSNDAFSGNFLNWASSSAIDMLRLSLTGGDRVIDTSTLTVLQRAIIPAGDPINMWNSSNFPSKRLYSSGTSRAITSTNFAAASYASGVPYFGAVPSAMATAAGSNDIFVANRLNQIYFGTAKSSTVSSYTLGSGSGAAIQKGPQATYSASLPTDAVLLGGENTTYTFTGVQEIWFGKDDATTTTWTVLPASGGIDCYWSGGGGPYGGINDPRSGVAKKCYRRPYTGSWTPTVSTAALNSDGYFFARVQVCDRDASTYALKDKRYWTMCTQYSDGATTPHASYKPTGVIQKYSEQLRLAAFGYLLDQTQSYSSGRYGGVLRAPMKYVGAKTFDASGNIVSGGNSQMEWNAVTGVFNANPDSNSSVLTTDGRSEYLSGVINYVNQFGRTGAVAGRYKKYDPIGELHYETLRYLQGLQPSADAISGLTDDMKDGYPVYTSWTDPYGDGRTQSSDYSCVKSNIVVIGDKNTHDGNRLPSADVANNIPDINAWRSVVQNFEKNVTSTYVDGSGTNRTTGNPNGSNSSVPTNTRTSQIMGSAYWARTHDIRGTDWTNAPVTDATAGTTLQRPGLRVKTFMFDVNEYGASNSDTARRTSNQLFMAGKYGGFETDPSNTAKNPYNTYGNPFVNEKDGSNNNDVWRDTDPRATRSGEANTYFLQSDARGVLSAFDDIFSRAATSAYNIGGGANNNKNTYSTDSTIYQGKFDTSDWSGDLEAKLTTTSALVWSAATRLSAMTAPATSRNIVVGKVGATANPVATDFSWGSIETTLQNALNNAPYTGTADGLGQDRLNYLRGDKSKEGSPFRARTKLLGDIVNSGVVYSGKPSTEISDSGYATFASTNATRTPAVFVGANDGMLHGFNATTGDELFAYIPSWLGSKLNALTSVSYGTSGSTPHQSYVDSMPAVAEAQVGSDWKTVLIGGTGGGGQGVFALDVTNPSGFLATKVMWEFTDADDPDLGNVTGKPQILKLRTNAYNATTPTYKWFAVVGSGVDNYINDGVGLFSSTGAPTLFLIDLSKAAGSPWALGGNYYKIPLPVDSTLSASKPTGLINFTAELGADGAVALLYMGDLHGNLWKLDFTVSAGITEWNINKLSSFNKGTTSSPDPYPLFIAKDSSGNVQPITAAPLIAPGPDKGTRFVYFGTGKYYEIADKSNTAVQTEYMVYDTGDTSGDTLVGSAVRTSAVSGRLRLKLGTADTSTGIISTPAFTLGRAKTELDTEVIRSGWYVDLLSSGERQVSDATPPRLSSKLIFNSLYPGVVGSGGCTAAIDSGRTYTVDIATGNGSTADSTVGLLGEAMVIERPDLTTKTLTDTTGRRITILSSEVYQLGSQGWKKIKTETTAVVSGRISWRQIHNYQDLKN